MALTSSRETVGKTEEVQETIQDAAKKGLKVPENLIQDFGDVLLSKEKLGELEAGKLTVTELSKLQREQLGGSIDTTHIETSLGKSADALKAGKLEAKEALQSGEELLKSLDDNIRDSKAGKKTQEAITQVKEKGTELIASGGIHALVEKLKNSDSLLENIFGFLLGLVAMMVPKDDTVEEVKEKVEEITNPEKRAEHIQTVNEFTPKLITSIEKKLNIQHPILKDKISELINQPEIINEQQLELIAQELEKGTPFSISLLKDTLNTDQYDLFIKSLAGDPEIKNALKLKSEKILVEHLTTEFGITLNKEKREKLHTLVRNNFTNFAFGNLFDKYMNHEAVTGFDLAGALFDDGDKAISFNLSLVTEGIIGFSQLTFNIINKGGELIQVGLSSLGVTGELTFEDFAKHLENLGEDERHMILAVLYRKGGLALEIGSKLLGVLSKSVLEVVTPSTLSFTDEVKNALGNTDHQIKSYQKLVGIVTGGKQDELIKEAVESVKRVATQTKIADILDNAEKYKYTEAEIKADFNKLHNEDLYDKNILKQLDGFDYSAGVGIQSIRNTIAQNMHFNASGVNALKAAGLGLLPGQHNFARDLENSLQNVFEFQKSRIRNGKWGMQIFKAAKGVRASFEQMNVTTKFDKLVFESGNLSGIRDSLSEMKRFATQFPDQAKMAFGSIAEIAMIGISVQMMEENKDIQEEIFDNLLYMTGLFGSGYMLLSIGGIRNEETGELDIINAGLSAAGGALLLLDASRTISILGYNGVFRGSSWLKVGTDVVLRPVTNLGKGLIHTGKGIYNGSRAAASLGSEVMSGKFDWTKLKTNMLSKLKNSKGRIGFILALGSASVAGVSYAMEGDISGEYEEMIEQGIIDKDGKVLDKQKAKQYFNEEFNEEEKRIFIELVLNNNDYIEVGNNINISNISENNIVLEANKNIQKWCIEPEQREMLANFGYEITFA